MRHIVFDFDGPIFDGRKAAETALRETVQHFATQFGEPSLSVTGLPLYGPKRMISTLYTDFGVHERGTIQEFYEERLQQIERAIGIPPAVRSQLDRLIEGGFKIALYSARLVGNLQPLLHDLGLATYFGVPELGCMPKYRKPSGDFLKCVAAHYGVPPKEVLFIGDSDWDYRAAKDAGAVYYHAAWTREPTAESARHASVAVNSLDELLDLLRDATIYKDFTADESALWDSVRLGAFSFYAGAGISVPSNIGGWESHYRPLLARVGAGYLSSEADLPETLQVLSARTARAQRMFDEFRDSFKKTHVRRLGERKRARSGHGRALPVAEICCRLRQGLFGRDVANRGKDAIARPELAGVESRQVGARNSAHRFLGAVQRVAVGRSGKDESLKERVGGERRVIAQDFERGERLLAFALNLLRRERRAAHHVGKETIRQDGVIGEHGQFHE